MKNINLNESLIQDYCWEKDKSCFEYDIKDYPKYNERPISPEYVEWLENRLLLSEAQKASPNSEYKQCPNCFSENIIKLLRGRNKNMCRECSYRW